MWLGNSFEVPLYSKKIKNNNHWKIKLLEKADCIKKILANLSKYVKITTKRTWN